jgi:nucleoside-diphosphate-sugar epimerase
MNVLITGAAGFIGSHLVDKYLADGHVVAGVDNFCTGDSNNLREAENDGRFLFVQADICTQWHTVEAELERSGFVPQYVLHMASPASPVDYGNLPLQTLAVNSQGTRNCADASLRWGARMLFASTSEAYGDPLEHPQRESYWGNVNPVGIRSCYDESKRFGEALMTAYVREAGLDGRVIRIFNTYGPRMRQNDGRVVPNFITQALRGEPLTIYGNGSQSRSFCYVDDLVEGIRRTVIAEKARGVVVNLGNPEEYTIRQFAEIVCEIVGVPLQTVNKRIPQDDPARRCPDITRAMELLGWQPSVNVRDGLQRTIEYFHELLIASR